MLGAFVILIMLETVSRKHKPNNWSRYNVQRSRGACSFSSFKEPAILNGKGNLSIPMQSIASVGVGLVMQPVMPERRRNTAFQKLLKLGQTHNM